MRTITELFDVGAGVAIPVLAVCGVAVVLALAFFIHSAPPKELTISTGPEGSSSQRQAGRYAKILEKTGVKLKILPSNGSFENLQRLIDPKSGVDIGFVQGGVSKEGVDSLVSLGNTSYQPLMIFYRGKKMDLLSDLAGKRIAIGPKGSGVRVVALALLGANGIKDPDEPQEKETRPGREAMQTKEAEFLDLGSEEASKALLAKQVDAAFVMAESTPMPILRALMRSKEVQLFSFKQAAAYVRKIQFMNVLEFPEGGIDLGQNIPAHDVTLLGPMVELVAKSSLHPALSDLLLEAMVEVHSRPGMYQKRGEFPNAQEHTIKISEDAARFYKSGKSFLYRYLPFWLASVLSRLLFAFIPTLVVLIPIVRAIPALLRWRVNTRIRRHYKELLALEKNFVSEKDPARRTELRQEFDRIEDRVNRAKIRPAFADLFYGLRGHINYVRDVVGRR